MSTGFSGSPISASKITGFYEATVSIIEQVGGISGGVGLTSVATSGTNLLGNGQAGNPLYLNNTINISDVNTTNISSSNLVIVSKLTGSQISSSHITASNLIVNGNLQFNKLNGSIISGSSLDVSGNVNITGTMLLSNTTAIPTFTIFSDTTNDQQLKNVFDQTQTFDYSFSSITSKKDGSLIYGKIKYNDTDGYFTNYYNNLEITPNNNLYYAVNNYLQTAIYSNLGDVKLVYGLQVINFFYDITGTIESASAIEITDYIYNSDPDKIKNNYGLHLYPLEAGEIRYPLYLQNNLDSTKEFIISNSGNLGLGTKQTTEKLNVVGNTILSGNLIISGTVQVVPKQIINITSSAQQIAPDASLIKISSSSPYTLTSTPTILVNHYNEGTKITIVNIGSSNIDFKDENAISGTKLKMSQTTYTQQEWGCIQFILVSGSTGKMWVECGKGL